MGFVNERGYLKPLFFYSLVPQCTKYQLKKDQKRQYDDLDPMDNDIQKRRNKKMLMNEEEKVIEAPSQHPRPSQGRKQAQEDKEVIEDPRIQTIIQIVFSRLDEVTENLEGKFKDLVTRVSQIENKITGLAHKITTIQQNQRNTSRERSTGSQRRGGARGRGRRSGRRGRTNGRSADQEIWDEFEEEL